MRFHHVCRTAFKALRRSPLRAFLTTLGIVIGVSSVIAMMEIGTGSTKAVQKAIASMGANILMIMPEAVAKSGVSQGAGTRVTLTAADSEAILRSCPTVRAVAPLVRGRAQAVYGGRNWLPNGFYGTTPSFLTIRDWEGLDDGEPFTERDVTSANKVCIVGQTVARELFGDKKPVGEVIRVNNVPLRILGVLRAKGANLVGMDQDDIILAPWTTVKYRVLGGTSPGASGGSATTSANLSDFYPGSSTGLYPEKSETQTTDSPMIVRFAGIDQILVSARSAVETPAAIEEIKAVLRERHRLGPNDEDDFDIRDMTEMAKTFTSTSTMMTNLLLAVATISLVVGGVGIMNIMLVSVTERTREIGLRMAVGARTGDILRQFLIESVVLCLVGGALGIIIGHGGSWLIKIFFKWPVATSPLVIVLAVLVSASVGIVFGFYPAWKASRLDPIVALRHE